MGELQPGLVAEVESVVTTDMATTHTGSSQVLTTPSMIQLMERASVICLQPHLPPNHTTVGYEVHVKHLAPTPLGMRVRVRAELVSVAGRKLEMKVEAFDERQKVGEGTHRRAVVDLGKFKAEGKD